MKLATELHDAWASLLAYPDEEGSPCAFGALLELESQLVPGSEKLVDMRQFFESHDIAEREELFTRTFDGSDDRALEVGWHLHGENYARGALMVRFRKLLNELDLFEIRELPDHIGVVLGLVGRLDEERAGALARGVLIPALTKLLQGFEDSSNPYRSTLAGMQHFLSDYYEVEDQAIAAKSSERSTTL